LVDVLARKFGINNTNNHVQAPRLILKHMEHELLPSSTVKNLVEKGILYNGCSITLESINT
jgi:hypothetical protein